jgi:hypothetical protein
LGLEEKLIVHMTTIIRSFFIFEGYILLRLLLIIFGGAVNRNSMFSECFITVSYPLLVSAPTGHLQVECILVNS